MENINKRFLGVILDIAEAMLNCGAEIDRVEGTVMRMAKAYGAERVNVFAITSSIVVTLIMPDGEARTETRRVQSSGTTNFKQLEELNKISREYCSEKFSVNELEKRFKETDKPISSAKYYVGSVIAAAAFTVFFGGTLLDSAFAAVFAILICLFSAVSPKFCPNQIVSKFLCSLAIGIIICAVCRAFPWLNADKIIIGDIMLLIPGIALTNSFRNLIIGDTVSGLTRLTESLVQAASLAGGFMIAIALLGG